MNIVLSHPSRLPNLVPMMDIFHMAKVAFYCAGKYFKESGIDTARILAKCLRSNISLNIPCTFLLFPTSAFLRIFFGRYLLSQHVLRTSVFLSSNRLVFSRFFHISRFTDYRTPTILVYSSKCLTFLFLNSLGKPVDSYSSKMSCLTCLVFSCGCCFFLKR